jgi:hypothetical protein
MDISNSLILVVPMKAGTTAKREGYSRCHFVAAGDSDCRAIE